MVQRRISFFTQGCRLNQAETATLIQGFSNTFEVVPFQESADVVVINTCTVTENGDTDTRRLINKARKLNPSTKIALIGCQSQVLKEKLLELPNVHWVIGNHEKMSLPTTIVETIDHENPILNVTKLTRDPFTSHTVGVDTHHVRANLKIQDGCDFYCSFCIIPFARGPARSRDFQNSLEEAQALVKAGHQELILTGINLGTYDNSGKTLIDILDGLEAIPGLERIRISSIEPTTVASAVIAKMADPNSPVCAYLHLPIQSGSDDVLKGMRRHYNTQEYVHFVNQATQKVPVLGLGTDVIVGFPGETDTHFDETVSLLNTLPFSYFHVFSYSERSLTRATKLPDKVPPAIIARRSEVLRQLSHQKQTAFYTQFIGQTVPVLFEYHKNGYWSGTTEHYIKVKFKSNEDLKNTLKPVTLERVENGIAYAS